MGERQPGMGAGKGRIETQRHLEEVPRLLIVGLVEPICARGRGGGLPTSREFGGFRMARLRSRASISLAIEATMLSPISFRMRKASAKARSKLSVQTIRAVRVSASSISTTRRLPERRIDPLAT